MQRLGEPHRWLCGNSSTHSGGAIRCRGAREGKGGGCDCSSKHSPGGGHPANTAREADIRGAAALMKAVKLIAELSSPKDAQCTGGVGWNILLGSSIDLVSPNSIYSP